MSRLTRREFLAAGGTAAASLAMLSACGRSAPPVQPGDGIGEGGGTPQADDGYKALVAIFLHGGNDAFNMIVPTSGGAYDDYARARLEVALPRNQLLGLGAADNGVEFGAHPAMSGLQSLYQQGHAAVLSNVGTLVEPIQDGQVRSASTRRPPRLMSHNDQQDQWQKDAPTSLEALGWAGRAADLLAPSLSDQLLPVGLSYSGTNLLQTGRSEVGFSVSTSGPVDAAFLRRNADIRALYEALLEADHDHLFVREYSRSQLKGMDYNAVLAQALALAPDLTVTFPGDRLGSQLAAVAKLMSVREALGAKRQTFFVSMGGFDTHADQLTRHAGLLQSLSDNLAVFYQATESLGLAGNVTSFTVSDFGRSLTVNGDGTDHGWGTHQLVVGGAVRGGFHGQMPDLAPDTGRDYGGGRFAPSTSVDQYGATLLRWFGIDASDIPGVFPNIGRFDTADLGFLG